MHCRVSSKVRAPRSRRVPCDRENSGQGAVPDTGVHAPRPARRPRGAPQRAVPERPQGHVPPEGSELERGRLPAGDPARPPRASPPTELTLGGRSGGREGKRCRTWSLTTSVPTSSSSGVSQSVAPICVTGTPPYLIPRCHVTEVHELLEKPFAELVGHLPSKSGQVAGGCTAGEARPSDGQLQGAGRGRWTAAGPPRPAGPGVRALVTMAADAAVAVAGRENGNRAGPSA